VPLLERAIAAAGPGCAALAGVLQGAMAMLLKQQDGVPPQQRAQQVIGALQAGIGLLAGTDLRVGLAEQHLELGATFHELAGDDRPDLLGAAVQQYHDALQAVAKDEAPELFAATHANLAAAYLTMPMQQASDQLRLGVALASLREALTVYTPQTHPQRWASVQLNLANALVYAPSTHQGDNLVEAVELYEAVLATRDRDSDPIGYARVLANQGNALAHLGMFDHARGKLVEARFLFEEFKQYDAVTSVRGVLDEIARRTTMAAPAPATTQDEV
jgi:tetratricopeptide (TPR) repeat protein